MDELTKRALEKIESMAYENALFKEKCDTIVLWNIYWLAVAALEGKEKASALVLVQELSGCPTGGPNRELGIEE